MSLQNIDRTKEPIVCELRQIVKGLEDKMRCNCDLDNWQPEEKTGHSWVCRIHKAAMEQWISNSHNDYYCERTMLRLVGEAAWECSECGHVSGGSAPLMCPSCRREVMGVVVQPLRRYDNARSK